MYIQGYHSIQGEYLVYIQGYHSIQGRVSKVIDYSLTRNYLQLRVIIFISYNFAGLCIIGEISILQNYGIISRNFYNIILRKFVMIRRKKQNYKLHVITAKLCIISTT